MPRDGTALALLQATTKKTLLKGKNSALHSQGSGVYRPFPPTHDHSIPASEPSERPSSCFPGKLVINLPTNRAWCAGLFCRATGGGEGRACRGKLRGGRSCFELWFVVLPGHHTMLGREGRCSLLLVHCFFQWRIGSVFSADVLSWKIVCRPLLKGLFFVCLWPFNDDLFVPSFSASFLLASLIAPCLFQFLCCFWYLICNPPSRNQNKETPSGFWAVLLF